MGLGVGLGFCVPRGVEDLPRGLQHPSVVHGDLGPRGRCVILLALALDEDLLVHAAVVLRRRQTRRGGLSFVSILVACDEQRRKH